MASDATPTRWQIWTTLEVRRLTATHQPVTTADVERWAQTRSDPDDRIDLAIDERTTGWWLGEAVVNAWDPHSRSCGFRTARTRSARDQTYGTDATLLLLGSMIG